MDVSAPCLARRANAALRVRRTPTRLPIVEPDRPACAAESVLAARSPSRPATGPTRVAFRARPSRTEPCHITRVAEARSRLPSNAGAAARLAHSPERRPATRCPAPGGLPGHRRLRGRRAGIRGGRGIRGLGAPTSLSQSPMLAVTPGPAEFHAEEVGAVARIRLCGQGCVCPMIILQRNHEVVRHGVVGFALLQEHPHRTAASNMGQPLQRPRSRGVVARWA